MRKRILVLGAAIAIALTLAILPVDISRAEEPQQEPPQYVPSALPNDGASTGVLNHSQDAAAQANTPDPTCVFTTRADDPHLSSTRDAVSAHGWWEIPGVDWGCPDYADVEVKMQVWLCNVLDPNDCYFKTLSERDLRVPAGGGSGKRTTARIPCSTSGPIGYKSIVDVDLVDRSDPNDKEVATENVHCRPLAW